MIECCGPASLLVVIQSRMSVMLLARMSPEDIYQDALVHAWRGRESLRAFEQPSVRVFRAWLLTIIQNRICDVADREGAQKRGGTVRIGDMNAVSGMSTGADDGLGLAMARSTTPSRVASLREQAEAMRSALDSLPDDVRGIVRMRLFEQRRIEDIAAILEIGVSAVRHRLRKGVEIFERRLLKSIGTRSSAERMAIGTIERESMTRQAADSSSGR